MRHGFNLREFLTYGPRAQYAYWQGAGCAVMVILGDLFLIWKQQAKYSAAVFTALLTVCGFASAFTFAASLVVASQEGLDLVISLIGVSFVLLATNIIIVGVPSAGGNHVPHS